jgi:ParB family chromosome partitioning protein
VVREASDAETMEIALIENLQRKDLHAFEEADGLKVLAESYGYTHEKMAQKLGKSRTSVTEVLSLTNMPDEVRELCRLADIHSKSLLLQVVRQSSAEKMIELIERFQRDGLSTRQQMRAVLKPVEKPQRGRPRNFVFKYQPKEKTFSLALQFKRSEVPREEVVRALQSIIEDLLREDA